MLSLWCAVVTVTLFPRSLGGQTPQEISGDAVNRLVVRELSHQGVMKSKVVSHLDLTGPFETRSPWTFVAVEDDTDPVEGEDHGPVFLCLVKAAHPDCARHFYENTNVDQPEYDKPSNLLVASVVYANKSSPLLLLKVCGTLAINGNCNLATALYRYDRVADSFIRVFLNHTGHNNNQATRFVETGPLQGDLIVNNPTDNAPYGYWMEVYRAGDSGQYSRILRYRSVTHYGDGNPLAVADSEMPEILRRIGLWKPGDPLPAPPHLPKECKVLFMRQGEQWCK